MFRSKPSWTEFGWADRPPLVDSTLSAPTLTLTSGPGESGSSAADSGWRISVMGFCPELARPLAAPALILREAGRRGWVSGGVTAVRSSAAGAGLGDRGRLLLRSGLCSLHFRCYTRWLVTTVSWLPLRSSGHQNCKNPDVNISITWQQRTSRDRLL